MDYGLFTVFIEQWDNRSHDEGEKHDLCSKCPTTE